MARRRTARLGVLAPGEQAEVVALEVEVEPGGGEGIALEELGDRLQAALLGAMPGEG